MDLTSYRDSTASVSGGRGTTFDTTSGKYAREKSKSTRTRTQRGRVSKRITPEDDYQRLAERVWRRADQKGLRIRNQADFISVYETYMRDSNVYGDSGLRSKVFNALRARHSDVSTSTKTSQERVETFVEVAKRPGPKEFDVVALIKGRRIYARRTKFTYKAREVTVYRDKKGRFARKA